MAHAIVMAEYGGPEVLRLVERPDPIPGRGEVIVKMVAAGVNRADLFIRRGEWKVRAGLPCVPGLEVVGTVLATGDGVRGFAPGQLVMTMMQRLGGIHGERDGGYQTHVRVPADTLVKVPAGLDGLTAAGFGLAAVTAYMAIAALAPKDDDRVLVHGGSGGVGLMAIQMLAAGLTHVIATGTRPAKFELMRSAGAAEALDTTAGDWPSRVGSVDAVFDLVGAAVFEKSVALLNPGGRLVFVGGTSGGDLELSGWDLMKPVTVTGYSTETLTREELDTAIGAIAFMHERGTLKVPVVREFALGEAGEAHRVMEGGEGAGRVLLRG